MTASLRVPRPASSPPPSWWRAFVRRPSGRPASTKNTSATAARRSSVSYARRPRSRLGNLARLHRSRGGHRFRQASSPPVQARRFAATFPVPSPPAFIHARRNDLFQSFLPIPRRQPALASVLHFVRTWICYVRCLRFRLPPAKHSPSPIRITPLSSANPTNCKKKQPPHPKRRAAVAAVTAPPTLAVISPPTHPRKSSYAK